MNGVAEIVNTKLESESICNTTELKPVLETVKTEEHQTVKTEDEKIPILHWSSVLKVLSKKDMVRSCYNHIMQWYIYWYTSIFTYACLQH